MLLVYVYNTTSEDDGHLCYHDKSTEQNSVRGGYVIYHNERRQYVQYPNFYSKYVFNELCEVKVYDEYHLFRLYK